MVGLKYSFLRHKVCVTIIRMHIHIHMHGDSATNQRLDQIMATLEELNALLATIGTEVDKVSADTTNLLAQLAAIPVGGLTPEQQAAIDAAVASATSIASRLTALDASVPDVAATPAP